jgi:hypothetical protein
MLLLLHLSIVITFCLLTNRVGGKPGVWLHEICLQEREGILILDPRLARVT